MRRPILNNSASGAAETTGRTSFAMELDPRYCDVAVERWQSFAVKEAVLEGSGHSFAKMQAERLGATHERQ